MAIANTRGPEDGETREIGRRHGSQEHERAKASSRQKIFIRRHHLGFPATQEAQDHNDAQIADDDEVFYDHLGLRIKTRKKRRPSHKSGWPSCLNITCLLHLFTKKWSLIQGRFSVDTQAHPSLYSLTRKLVFITCFIRAKDGELWHATNFLSPLISTRRK